MALFHTFLFTLCLCVLASSLIAPSSSRSFSTTHSSASLRSQRSKDIRPTYKITGLYFSARNSDDGNENENDNKGDSPQSPISKYFVPGFVAFWAVGYTAIAAQQINFRASDDLRALGEQGGLLGVGLLCVLFFAVFAAAAVESFK